jgi:RHS repeat-associated protein
MPQLALERDSAGNAIRTYLQANGTVGLVEGGTTYYYTHDRLGSITGLTSASGNTEWKYTYEPYGALRTAVEVDPDAPVNPLNYIGQYEDPTNGFLDLRARQYDQTTGRFLSVDPAPSGPGTPFAGTYEYAGGDPINSYDLDGLRKRPGEYTPAQRRDKWEGNRTRNGGEARCEECGRVVVPGVKLGPGDKIDPNRGEIHHPVPGDNTVPGELLCRQCHLGGRHGQTLKVSPLPGTFTLPGFTPLGGGFSLPGYTPKPSGPEIGGFSFMPPIAKSGGYSIARQFDGYRP